MAQENWQHNYKKRIQRIQELLPGRSGGRVPAAKQGLFNNYGEELCEIEASAK